jgi:hypothetical protein
VSAVRELARSGQLQKWFMIAAFAVADLGRLSLFRRGFTLCDVFAVGGFAALLASNDVATIPAWYWLLAGLYALGTCLSLFLASPQALTGWALHTYFYLVLIPLVWAVTERDFRTALHAAAALFLTQSLVGLEAVWRVQRQHLSWWAGPGINYAAGMSSPTVLVVAGLIGASFLVFEWTSRRRPVNLVFITFGICSIVGGVVVSNKRTVWVELAVASVVFLMFVTRRLRTAVVALAIATSVALLGWVQLPEAAQGRFTGAVTAFVTSDTTLDSSYSARALVQDRVLSVFWKGPWTNLLVGYGYRRSPDYVGADLVLAAAPQAHNMLVNYLAETGVFGVFPLAALWLAGAAGAFTAFWRARRAFRWNRDATSCRIALLTGACAVGVLIAWIELMFTPDIFVHSAFFAFGVVMAASSMIDATSPSRRP